MFTTDRFPIQIIRNQVLSIVFGRVEGIAHTKTRYPKIGGMLAIPDQKERREDVQFGYHIGRFGYDRFPALWMREASGDGTEDRGLRILARSMC